jgi:hypothetical protein
MVAHWQGSAYQQQNIGKHGASARISKGQAGISRLKEKGREQFWPKKGNLHRTSKNLKNGQNFTPFWVNKMFSHTF